MKFTDSERVVKVRKAYYKEDAQLYGAVCNVISQVFEGRLIFNAEEGEDEEK